MRPFSDNSPQSDKPRNRAQASMHTLGYYGLIPFGAGAIIVWLSPWLVQPALALLVQKGTLVYAGIIAAYMAGMTAGNDLTHDRAGFATYLPGMIATLIAWLMVVPNGYFFFSLPQVWRMIIVCLVFGWLYLRDAQLVHNSAWPSWYGRLRLRLTAWVIIAMTAIIARLLLWGYV